MLTERIPPERLDDELGMVDDLRDPPIPVVAWLTLDGEDREGLPYGWAENPCGADDGWRGLVGAAREYAPGFWAEYLGWVRAEQITCPGG